jgi:hypothetical protein
MNPQEFVAKWRQVHLKESSAYQQHFIDVCRLVGHLAPSEIDPAGTFFTFQAGAIKTGGEQGFADVWYKGHFAWEYKGKHANLEKAYEQLLQYRESLQNPPLLIVSDLDQIHIHTNFTNTVKRLYVLSLDDLLKPPGLATLKAAFYNPEALKSPETTEAVTQHAAAHFSRLAEILRQWGEQPEKIAHFLIQLLFCLFAEDVGLLPNQLFSRLAESAHLNSQAFSAQLRQLFSAMATGGWFGSEPILHFDGRLFENDLVLDLDSEGLAILREVSALDWSSIEPSIFGTLFERSLDPTKRSQLGAHYTSKEDILLIVEPVLMVPLRRKWSEIQTQASALAKQRDKTSGKSYQKLQAQITALLSDFAVEIAAIQVLDPACGSGNFLYVALRQLLDLWKEVANFAVTLNVSRMMPLPGSAPSPEQLHGIEINEYAHQLAHATVWIGYIQWLNENGYGFPSQPVLKPLDNIQKMDAILAFDGQGQPYEPEWPKADVIIGNPPFLGGNKVRQELGDYYVEALFALYNTRVPAFSDIVCYWFEKARGIIDKGKGKRVGLLATNSIRGGVNRRVLERIKETGNIFWAESDRDWVLEGAAVNVSMIGFDDGTETSYLLDDMVVKNINPDLTSTVNLTTAQRLIENINISFQGPSPKAPFDIDNAIAMSMLNLPLNVNGRPNSDVIRPVVNAEDIVQNQRHKGTIDFNFMSEQQAAQYEAPFEFVRKFILPVRMGRRDDYRGQWWQYARPRPEMRNALEKIGRYIATPRISKHRIFVWLHKETLANDALIVFAFDSDYSFGILHSKPHELWALRLVLLGRNSTAIRWSGLCPGKST